VVVTQLRGQGKESEVEGGILFILTRNVIYSITVVGMRDDTEIWYADVKRFKLAQDYI